MRLKEFLKNSIKDGLLQTGRHLVIKDGSQALTARKLSAASNCSIGTIYNHFGNMDNFIIEENIQTLNELFIILSTIIPSQNSYLNLNNYIDTFVSYVLNNKNLWFLLFNTHINVNEKKLPLSYLKKLKKITNLCEIEFLNTFSTLDKNEKKLSWQILWLSIFSLSSYLITDGISNISNIKKKNITKLLLNTYLAGMSSLAKE